MRKTLKPCSGSLRFDSQEVQGPFIFFTTFITDLGDHPALNLKSIRGYMPLRCSHILKVTM
jgi:hypothetical protein